MIHDKVYYTRYFTYMITFPKDRDQWIDQVPFVHPISFEVRNMKWMKPSQKKDLIQKGFVEWKDYNSVHHQIRVEEIKRVRKWGLSQDIGKLIFKG